MSTLTIEQRIARLRKHIQQAQVPIAHTERTEPTQQLFGKWNDSPVFNQIEETGESKQV